MVEAVVAPIPAVTGKPALGISIKNLYKIFGPTPEK